MVKVVELPDWSTCSRVMLSRMTSIPDCLLRDF